LRSITEDGLKPDSPLRGVLANSNERGGRHCEAGGYQLQRRMHFTGMNAIVLTVRMFEQNAIQAAAHKAVIEKGQQVV
jgi:hypothetical protein